MAQLYAIGSASDISADGALKIDTANTCACTESSGYLVIAFDDGDKFQVGDTIGITYLGSLIGAGLIASITPDDPETPTSYTIDIGAGLWGLTSYADAITVSTAFTTGDDVNLSDFTDLRMDSAMTIHNLASGILTVNDTLIITGTISYVEMVGNCTLNEGAVIDTTSSIIGTISVKGTTFTLATLPFSGEQSVSVVDFVDTAVINLSSDAWSTDASSWTGVTFNFRNGSGNNAGGKVPTANFYDNSGNSDTVGPGEAQFYDESFNSGTLTGNAVFHDNAHNTGDCQFTVTFDDSSYATETSTFGSAVIWRYTGIVTLPAADKVASGTTYGTGLSRTGTMKTGQGIGGSGIIGMP